MRHLTILFVAITLGATSVSAQEIFEPAVVFPASHATLVDRRIDILELLPGMRPDEVTVALSALHGPDTIVEHPTHFQAGSRGVTVRTTDFLGTMLSGGEDDQVEVFFAGPASANQAFAIERTARYPNVLSAPTVKSITEALIGKYGVPSYNSSDYRETVSPALIWVYVAEQQVPCLGFGGYGNGQNCPVAWTLTDYTPQALANFASSPPEFDYAIVVDVQTHSDDRSKAASFTVTVSDPLRRKRAAQADEQALLVELERVHQLASQPAAAPAM